MDSNLFEYLISINLIIAVFICRSSQGFNQTDISNTDSTCPSGWFRWIGNNHCYLVVTRPTVWKDAKTACDTQNAFLIIVGNLEESDFLGQYLYGLQIKDAWVCDFYYFC
jgi:hypothetical protein